MKKKFFVALLILLMMLGVGIIFIACENDSHTHTFATSWSWDETYHWHEATCEHKDEVNGKAEHNFVDNQCTVCGYKKDNDTEMFTVTYDSQGGSYVESVTVKKGSLIKQPQNPTKNFYVFDGWYKDKDCTERWWFDVDKVTSSITLYAKWAFLDNGHSIKSSEDFEFIDDTTLSYNNTIRHETQRFDLRNKFEVSNGAEWRAFGTPECLQPTEITSRTIDLIDGWNEVYILVENSTTYEQTVYTLRVYRNRILNVPIYYNETVQYATVQFEENVEVSENKDAKIPVFSLENYSWDNKYYTSDQGWPELTQDTIITESTSIYVRAYCHAVTVNSNGMVTGMPEQPGQVHLVIPDTVSGQKVRSIASEAFQDISNIVAVNIPDSVTYVGENAFSGTSFYNRRSNWSNGALYCDNILLDTKLLIGEYRIAPGTRLIACGAFRGMTSLTSVIIPDSVTSIGTSAFYGCTSLESITIPDSVTSIGASAFNGCMTEIKWGSTPAITTIGDYAFSGYKGTTITIPDSVTSIGKYAFEDCTSLTSIIIPERVTSMGWTAFGGCTSLESITIPFVGATKDSTTNTHFGYIFGASSYSSNEDRVPSSLKTVVITGGTSIGSNAFYNCASLTSITIPSGVTSIGDSAFGGCSVLTIYCEAESQPNGWSDAWNSSNCPVVWNSNNNETAADGYIYIMIDGVRYALKDSVATVVKQLSNIFGSITLPASVAYNDEIYSVENIEDSAFSGCSSLTSITIPDSVTSIGEYAFAHCTSLTSITIPDSVTRIGSSAFYNCSALESITIPFVGATKNGTSNTHFGYIFGASPYSSNGDRVPSSLKTVVITGGTSIGKFAFDGCTSLTSVTIPESVTSIGNYAFEDCTSLTSITIPDSVTSIGNYAFEGCSQLIETEKGVSYVDGWVIACDTSSTSVSLRTNTKGIADSAFSSCPSIMSITIPSGVASIGENAFYGCSSLESVTFGANSQLTSIGSNAFYNCTSLTSITIPSGVASIGENAFYGCSSLESVTFGANSQLTSIGDYAFYNCTSLTSIIIPERVTSMGWTAFGGCTSLESITIPFVGATKDGTNYAYFGYIFGASFSDNNNCVPSSLETIIITGGTSIGWNAFRECISLTSVTIPDSVTSIGTGAFYECFSLTSVTIGCGITEVESAAFYNCNIQNVYISDLAAWCEIDFGPYSNPLGESGKLYVNDALVTSLTIPDTVTNIGDYAFFKYSFLTSVTIPNSVTSIGYAAFHACSALESLTIPSSVTSIGRNVFGGCTSLESVYITDMTAWCNISFGGEESNPLYYAHRLYLNNELVTDLVIPDGVTSIGDYAFAGCTSLTSITIPDSVTSIGRYAFKGCTAEIIWDGTPTITSIGNYAFSEYAGDSITIPDSVTSIRSDAFYKCTSLTSITIPDSVTSIGDYAFYGCKLLESISIPDSVTSIGDYVFDGTKYYSEYHANKGNWENGILYLGSFLLDADPSISGSSTISEGTTVICAYAFAGCTSLTSITIPISVTRIGSSAFSGCTSLESVYITDMAAWYNISFGSEESNPLYYAHRLYLNNELVTDLVIPDGVTSIGAYAFAGCASLTSITIPSSVTSIGDYAFSGCSSLTSITIPSSVTSIGSSAFADCSALESITIPFVGATKDGTSNTHFGYIFGASFSSSNEDCVPSSLKTVVITEGTSIGDSAFSGCSSLTSITIPSSVTSIGSSAFGGCTSLTSITIPSRVTSIGGFAFSGCSSLTSIVIPDSVTRIGSSAFYNCSALESITIPFVGVTKDGTSNTHFGYIFGALTYQDNDEYVPSSLKTVVITGGTNIGSSAFRDCTSLTSITIPDSVTSIGRYAFKGCTAEIIWSEEPIITTIGEFAFSEYAGDSITIPDGVTSIGEYAFNGSSSLTSITIPSSVTSIGAYAFAGCSALESITIPFVGATKDSTTNTHFGYIFGASSYSSNEDCVPSSLKTVVITGGTSIGSNAFYNCAPLTSITIPDSVTTIGVSTFSGCTSLTSVYITNLAAWCNISFENKYSNPLYYAQRLYLNNELVTDLVIPDSVTSIGEYAFSGCKLLESVTIPDSVTSIGNNAFRDCTSLTSITIPSSVTSIGDSAFSGCKLLESVTIPDSVTSIGNYAFSGCSALESITIPFVGATKDGTSNTHFGYIFGASTYQDNDEYVPSSLKTVVITGGTSIGSNAFYNCTSLTSITIPESVTSIGWSVLKNCNALLSINYRGNIASWCGIDGVKNLDISKVYIGNQKLKLMTSITIPSSVTNIGEGAFRGCTLLKNVTFEEGSNLTSIGNDAFRDCTALKEIEIPNNVTSIGYSAFGGCISLESITLPFVGDSMKTSEDTYQYPLGYIFGESSYLGGIAITQYYHGNSTRYTTSTTYYIPSSLRSVTVTGINILEGAFYGCSMLTSVTVASSVASIDEMAFYDCSAMTIYCEVASRPNGWSDDWKATVCPVVWNSRNNETAEDGNIYTVINGIRYALKNSVATVVRQPSSIYGSITIPTSVTYKEVSYCVTGIDKYAFLHCNRLTGVTIPDGIMSISYSAFWGCTSLKTVTIPNSVTSIESSAFGECTSLEKFNYKGTKKEWAAVVKDPNWRYGSLKFGIYCSDGWV